MLQSEITTAIELNLNLNLCQNHLQMTWYRCPKSVTLGRLSFGLLTDDCFLMVFQNLSSLGMIYLEGISYVAIRDYNAIRRCLPKKAVARLKVVRPQGMNSLSRVCDFRTVIIRSPDRRTILLVFHNLSSFSLIHLEDNILCCN